MGTDSSTDGVVKTTQALHNRPEMWYIKTPLWVLCRFLRRVWSLHRIDYLLHLMMVILRRVSGAFGAPLDGSC